MKAPIQGAIGQEVIEDQRIAPLARMTYGAFHEAAMLIAPADDKALTRRAVKSAVESSFGRPGWRAAEVPN
jgi:hypothetical protein